MCTLMQVLEGPLHFSVLRELPFILISERHTHTLELRYKHALQTQARVHACIEMCLYGSHTMLTR